MISYYNIIGLNSVLDYDKFNNANVGQKASQLLLGLLGLQIGYHSLTLFSLISSLSFISSI